MQQADTVFDRLAEFVQHLRLLRHTRLANKAALRPEREKRRTLSRPERAALVEKTGARCHICGGPVSDEDGWVADHVLAHAHGGRHSPENYLPAHRICNRARWFYEPEEFQWILKLGVYFRTQLEEQANPDAQRLAAAFLTQEQARHARQKPR